MEIIDCIIDSYEITYKAIEILKLLSEHVDKQPS